MTDLPECFLKFTVSSGDKCRWSGVVRSGNASPDAAADQMIGLCRRLQDGQADKIFKDSSKIKAGIIDGYFVKMYKLPGFSAQLRRRFRRGRAMHCLLAAEAIARAGVSTPQVEAVLQVVSGWNICDFLVTRALDKELNTCNYLLCGNDRASYFLENNLLPAAAMLHQNGIAHGDLNLRNIYGDPSMFNIGVIDLDGVVMQNSPLDMSSREAELARLVSGCCKLCPDEDPGTLIKLLTARYEQLCNVKCNEANILKRTKYLLTRKR